MISSMIMVMMNFDHNFDDNDDNLDDHVFNALHKLDSVNVVGLQVLQESAQRPFVSLKRQSSYCHHLREVFKNPSNGKIPLRGYPPTVGQFGLSGGRIS